jgi:uncharacterized membrane protein
MPLRLGIVLRTVEEAMVPPCLVGGGLYWPAEGVFSGGSAMIDKVHAIVLNPVVIILVAIFLGTTAIRYCG